MKILQNEITGTQTSFSTNFGGKLSFILCFICFERLHCIAVTYIFTAPTTAIIILELCASNIEFQHFILRFNKISLLKEGIRGQRKVDTGQNRGQLYR
jgi:hypothetical protein